MASMRFAVGLTLAALAAVPALAQDKSYNQGGVKAMYFSADGKQFGTAGLYSGQIYLTLVKWPGLTQPVESEYAKTDASTKVCTGLTVSPDGRTWATAHAGDVWLWDAASKRPLDAVKAGGAVSFAEFLENRVLLLAGGVMGEKRRGLLKLWDTKNNKEIADFELPHPVVSWHWSPGHNRLTLLDAAGTIRLWSVEKKGDKMWALKETQTFAGGPDLRCFAFSADGKKLVTGGGDRKVRLWDVEAKKELTFLDGHTGAITFVAFTPDGDAPISWSADGTVRLWDVANDKEAFIWNYKNELGILSPDGKTVASSDGSQIRFWDLATMAKKKP